MAEPGDPFDTKDFNVQRRRQRRLLALIDDHDIARTVGSLINWPPPVPGDARSRALLEAEFRTLADDEAGELQPLLEPEAARVVGRLLNDFLAAAVQRQQRAPGGVTPFTPLRASAESRANAQVTIEEKDADAFHRLIAVLLWADACAPDGYRDPRVPATG